MSDRLTNWKRKIIDIGLFIIFLALFGKFVALELWHALAPFFATLFAR